MGCAHIPSQSEVWRETGLESTLLSPAREVTVSLGSQEDDVLPLCPPLYKRPYHVPSGQGDHTQPRTEQRSALTLGLATS